MADALDLGGLAIGTIISGRYLANGLEFRPGGDRLRTWAAIFESAGLPIVAAVGGAVDRASVLREHLLDHVARDAVVLDDVDAEFRRGEIIALRGRSGSGKSTLLNLISGIDQPDAGEVIVAGINLTQLGEHERTLFRRKHIGFVYQSFNLVPTLNVADNIRLVLELNKVPFDEATARINTLLESVQLADRANSYPDILSGGEQQRVAIARALSHRPSVLLADEPTGNLDAGNGEHVLNLMLELNREMRTSLVIVTHDHSIANRMDRVLVLEDGRLVEQPSGSGLRAGTRR